MLARCIAEWSPRGETRISLRVVVPSVAEVELRSDLKNGCSLSVDTISRTDAKNKGRHQDLFKLQSGFGHPPAISKFTLLAKRTVEDAAAILEELCGLDCLFVTLTLPGQRKETKTVLSNWSAWLVAQLKSWLHRKAPSALSVGVWERQKGGALHLHLVVGSKDVAERTLIKSGLIDCWLRLLQSLTVRTGINLFLNGKGVDYSERHDLLKNQCEPVKKSVAKYLSKYCSKASSKNFGGATKGTSLGLYYPTRWWFIDKRLREEIKSRRIKIETQVWQLQCANDFFEAVAGNVLPFSAKQYPYENPIFTTDRYLVLLHNGKVQNDAAKAAVNQLFGLSSLKLVGDTKGDTNLERLAGKTFEGPGAYLPAHKEPVPVRRTSRDIFQHFMNLRS